MFKAMTITLFLTTTLFGGLLDFRTLDTAKKSYEAGNYSESAKEYSSLSEQNDEVNYNLGNAYYKDKKYDKAIEVFKQVQRPELKAKALHNMGNAYAQSKKVDEAIKAYEEALKLNDDEDTKYNLELLKKKKQDQEKKQNDKNKKDDQQKDKDKKKQDQQNKDDQDKKDQQRKDDQKSDQDKKNDDKNKKQEQSDQKSDKQKQDEEKKSEEQKQKEAEEKAKKEKEEKQKKEEAEAAQGEPKELPISDMQERKYEKMLDKRGIKTLMVPLKTQGGHDDETTAW